MLERNGDCCVSVCVCVLEWGHTDDVVVEKEKRLAWSFCVTNRGFLYIIGLTIAIGVW